MSSRPLRLFEFLGDDPIAIGHQHGETLRREIYEIAEIRLERMCAISPYHRIKDILALAERHIPILEEFDADLFLELKGIAESSNVSLPRLIVLNHYTDMRDIAPPGRANVDDLGGCSIIFSPTPEGPVLGQTWDIHGSALPYVMMMKLDDMIVFSIAGCLGMTGLNQSGLGLAINNLMSIDAKVGIIWPALVRKALLEKSALQAKELILKAPLGSGRHFAIADRHQFFSIETSGTAKKVVSEDAHKLYFHTNHCLDPEMRKTHTIGKESSTFWRYQHLDEVLRHQDLSSSEKVFLALAEVSMPVLANDPNKTATCGTFVMDIGQHKILACQGTADQELLRWAQTSLHL